MMNYIKTIFNTYKKQPKFAFGFHGELSHDSYNDIGVVDDDLYSWVKDLYDLGHLNNTILILMSDHGHRFKFCCSQRFRFLILYTLYASKNYFRFTDLQTFVILYKANKRKDYHFSLLFFHLGSSKSIHRHTQTLYTTHNT